jgi:hypothetical protein
VGTSRCVARLLVLSCAALRVGSHCDVMSSGADPDRCGVDGFGDLGIDEGHGLLERQGGRRPATRPRSRSARRRTSRSNAAGWGDTGEVGASLDGPNRGPDRTPARPALLVRGGWEHRPPRRGGGSWPIW